MPADHFSSEDYGKFERIYTTYAPKLLGFISLYAHTKEHAEVYLEKVFVQVARDINYFDLNTERKLLNILLLICKPIFEGRESKNYSIAI